MTSLHLTPSVPDPSSQRGQGGAGGAGAGNNGGGAGRSVPGAAPGGEAVSFYEAVGGAETFVRLIDTFYDGVRADPLLAPMYPEADFDGAKHRLRTFLVQFYGGPKTYSAERGHPRLRMRHAPFPVSPAARDAWLHHMRVALDSVGLAPLHRAQMWDYFERAATSMINTYDGGPAPLEGQTVPDRLE